MAEIKDDMYNRIYSLVEDFANDEECFGDAAQLRISPETLDAVIIDDPDEDFAEYDYYMLGDLVAPQTDGSFIPDSDAVTEIVNNYSK